MVDPEVDTNSAECVYGTVGVRRHHCYKRSENVYEESKVEYLIKSECKTDRYDKHCRIAKVQGQVGGNYPTVKSLVGDSNEISVRHIRPKKRETEIEHRKSLNVLALIFESVEDKERHQDSAVYYESVYLVKSLYSYAARSVSEDSLRNVTGHDRKNCEGHNEEEALRFFLGRHGEL